MLQRSRLSCASTTLVALAWVSTAVAEPPRHGRRHAPSSPSPHVETKHLGKGAHGSHGYPGHGKHRRDRNRDLSLGLYGWGPTFIGSPPTLLRSRSSYSHYDVGPPAWQPNWQPGTVTTYGLPPADGRTTVNVADLGNAPYGHGWLKPETTVGPAQPLPTRANRGEYHAAWQQLIRGDIQTATIAFHELAASAPNDGLPMFGVGVVSLVSQSETTAVWSLRRAVQFAGSELREVGRESGSRRWLADLAALWSQSTTGEMHDGDRRFVTALLRYVTGDFEGAASDVAAAQAVGDSQESTLTLAELVGRSSEQSSAIPPPPSDAPRRIPAGPTR